MAIKGKPKTPGDSLLIIEEMLWSIVNDESVNAAVRVQASRELRNVIADREAVMPTVTHKVAQLQALKRAH